MTEVGQSLDKALAGPIRLSDLETRGADGAIVSSEYCVSYVQQAINQICAANKRSNSMSDDECKELAERIYKKHRDYTIEEVKLFAEMLIDGELITYNLSRQPETKLISVDASSIMDKLKVYDRLRTDKLNSYKAQQIAYKEYAETHVRKFKDLGRWEREHDFYGNYIEGWKLEDAEKYWHDFNMHYDINGNPLPPGTDPYEYWNGRLPEDERQAFILRLERKIEEIARNKRIQK